MVRPFAVRFCLRKCLTLCLPLPERPPGTQSPLRSQSCPRGDDPRSQDTTRDDGEGTIPRILPSPSQFLTPRDLLSSFPFGRPSKEMKGRRYRDRLGVGRGEGKETSTSGIAPPPVGPRPVSFGVVESALPGRETADADTSVVWTVGPLLLPCPGRPPRSIPSRLGLLLPSLEACQGRRVGSGLGSRDRVGSEDLSGTGSGEWPGVRSGFRHARRAPYERNPYPPTRTSTRGRRRTGGPGSYGEVGPSVKVKE